MIKQRIVLTLSVLVLSIAPFGSVQAQDATTVARLVVEFLRKQLPAPMPAVETYTYEPTTFPDTSLGCPTPGQSYTQTPTPGYIFQVTLRTGIIHEVHTNLDGSALAYCDPNAVRVKLPLTTYRTPLYRIDYPAKWRVTVRSDSEVYLGPAAIPACIQPGILVTTLGYQPQTVTAATLLDQYLAQTPSQVTIGDRVTMGTIGVRVRTSGACTDGSPRGFQVATIMAFGQGYRIVQFAPGTGYIQWSELFDQIVMSFSAAATTSAGDRVLDLPGAPNTLLVHVLRGNVYMATLDDLPGAPITRDADIYRGGARYGQIRIAPEGRRLLFTDSKRGGLYVQVIQKSVTPLQLGAKLADTGFAPTWSPDGKQIAYLSGEAGVTLKTIDEAGAIKSVGAFEAPPCPLNPETQTDPAARALQWDRGSELLFEWVTPTLLIHSRACNGLGVLKVDLTTGSGRALDTLLTRPTLSPDRTRLVGLSFGKVTLVDLATEAAQSVTINATVDRVVWGEHGKSLYYTTRTLRTPLKYGGATTGYAAFDSAVYELTLHWVELDTGRDNRLFQAEGFAFGSLAPHREGIAFTLVESSAALIDGLGRLTNPLELTRLEPSTWLYWLPNGAQTPFRLANTGSVEFGPTGSQAVIGLPVVIPR